MSSSFKWNDFSEETKNRIKNAFSNLGSGDIIESKDESFLVIRTIEGKGAVIATMCGSQCHVENIFDETFSWSDDKHALVDSKGAIAPFWSYDAQVEREQAISLAEEYTCVPVSADNPTFSDMSNHKELVSAEKSTLVECAKMLYHGSPIPALQSAMKALDISVTEEQVILLTAVLTGVSVQREEADRRKIITSIRLDMKNIFSEEN